MVQWNKSHFGKAVLVLRFNALPLTVHSILEAIALSVYLPCTPPIFLFFSFVSYCFLYFIHLHTHTHAHVQHMHIVLHPAGPTSPRGPIWGSRAGTDGAMYWWLLSRGFGLCTHQRLCCRLGMGICTLQPWCFFLANGHILTSPTSPFIFFASRSSRDRNWQTQFGPGTHWQPHPLSAPVDSCQPCPPGQPGVKNHWVHLVRFSWFFSNSQTKTGTKQELLASEGVKLSLKLGASECVT